VLARLVPARLVQTWKTLDLGALAPIARTWREWNPGFAYTLFDDAACAALISDRFGARVASAYARIGPGAFRADLWRYCELYANGGVYVDIDTACLGAVYDVLDPSASLAVPVDLDPTNLFNAFVAAAPEHPVMRMCIDAVVENVEANKPQFGLGFSGPGLLGACVAAYLGAPYPTAFEARTVAGVQFLRFDAATEVVSNAHGAALMQNKNGSRAIHEAYEAEATRASVVRYEMHGP
jgi:mannosyltransferase OCH1-like enzyme